MIRSLPGNTYSAMGLVRKATNYFQWAKDKTVSLVEYWLILQFTLER
jgi:hypothetical protein